jgi:FdhD protein
MNVECVDTMDILRIIDVAKKPICKQDQVVVEEPFTIKIDCGDSFTILCMPTNLRALTVGFLYAEGIITSEDDIVALEELQQNFAGVLVKLKKSNATVVKNKLLVTSSGRSYNFSDVEEFIRDIPRVQTKLILPLTKLNLLVTELQSRQIVFQQTGGTHAAAIFNAAGEIVAFAEDIGRHNALDKVIGDCLLRGIDMRGCGVVLSSRVSAEMVLKTARARLEFIVAVSAPTSLAIKIASKLNITLCGFVRGQRANIYVGATRVI